MSRLDDRLTRELERVTRPADPAGVFEQIDRRHSRRQRVHKIQAGALVVLVLAGTLGGVSALSKAFRSGVRPGGTSSTTQPTSNGRIVVAQRSNGGLLQLVSVEPDGSNPAVIPIDTGQIGQPWLAAWSPDGTRLVVATSTTGSGPDALWVMGADGSDPVRVAAAANVYQPSWSPDGTRIAYAADTVDGSAIHVSNADGTADRTVGEIVPAAPHYYSAAFSPDGTQILYDAGTSSRTDLFVMNADGSDVRRLTDTATDYSPSWSPDASRIAFSRRVGTGSDIFVMDADGSNARRLTSASSTVTNRDPIWSPDGSMIAYRSSPSSDGSGALVVMGADGAGPVILLDGGVLGIAWQTPPTAPSPTLATPTGPIDLGLAFPVCDPRTLSADMDGDGTLDTVTIATKMSDAANCPARGTTTEILAVDLDGDGKADAVGGPLACPSGCEPFASPDIDGDGRAELAIVADRPGDGTERIQLWRLMPAPAGGSLAMIPFVDANGDPATFTWGTLNNWGGNGPQVFGASCTTRTTPPLVTAWEATPTGPTSFTVHEHGYHVVGNELRTAFDDNYQVPGEETVFPDGGGTTMCGAPVVAQASP